MSLWRQLADWYIADAAASLIVAPVVVLWAITQRHPIKSKWATLETAAVFLLTIAIGIIAFIPLDDGPLADLQALSERGRVSDLCCLCSGPACAATSATSPTAALIFCVHRGVGLFGRERLVSESRRERAAVAAAGALREHIAGGSRIEHRRRGPSRRRVPACLARRTS